VISKAHQRIIREKMEKEESYNLFGKWWDDINKSKNNSNIKEITRKQALPVILKYEWLGTLPVNYNKFCGLYFGSALAGVTCFVEVKFGGKFTLYNYPAVCLGRGACVHWCPDWGGSYLIQNSIKMLYKNKNPRYVVAFSDWDAGEIGTLYQACNWVYLGHKNTREWVDRNGKRYDINTPAVRAVSGFARKNNKGLKATKKQRKEQEQKMIKEGYRLVDGAVRGKYATIIGRKNKKYREMKKLLIENSKPYPKRNNAEQVSREKRNTTSIEGEGQFFGSAQ
tara:strand:+ start:1762 stop:2604 length:843 start_codon:yes stop_codon:yes gene_type:complete